MGMDHRAEALDYQKKINIGNIIHVLIFQFWQQFVFSSFRTLYMLMEQFVANLLVSIAKWKFSQPHIIFP